MATHAITIKVDDGRLASYPDAHLAALWHVAQANPAPHGDPNAGQLAEHVGREVVRRWLRATEPELWHHQGRDHYWAELRKLATFQPGADDPASPQWLDGTWTPRTTDQEA